MGMGVFQQKNQKMPGAHKIGKAISGPRIAGGNFMDIPLEPLEASYPFLVPLPSSLKIESLNFKEHVQAI